jgi:hypothetical protein|tara:strand:- start:22 stop:243 length:222 start_codon:yes stop_codon:yes gene_type:complete
MVQQVQLMEHQQQELAEEVEDHLLQTHQVDLEVEVVQEYQQVRVQLILVVVAVDLIINPHLVNQAQLVAVELL